LKYVEGYTDHGINNIIDFTKQEAKNVSIENDLYKLYHSAYHYAMDMTIKECHQACEGMYHNLNTLQSRSGNQLPFSSVNYGTCTEPEGRMVIKALLEVSIEGLGKNNKTSIFPCGIFQYMKGVNDKPGTPNYDLYKLALESTSKRLYPNYCNVDWSGNAGYDINDPKTYMSTMGCRTVNGFDINGFGYLKDGRGNIAPVTIILPTIAMLAKKKCEKDTNGLYNDEMMVRFFLTMLDKKIHEAKDQLIERFEHICKQPISAAKFMWENNMMAGFDGVNTRSALKHGTLAIGQLGLAEALQILVGCDHTEPKGMELAKRIEALFQKRCKEFKTEEYTAPEDGSKYYLNFGVYYSPKCNI
jgi:ribonucleoside-triphosphate reductase